MGKTIGEQMREHSEREQRINQRLKIVEWFGKRWENFRLIQHAALWRYPDQPIPIDDNLATGFRRTRGEILMYAREAEKLGLVTVFEDTAGKSHAFQITHEEGIARELIDTLYR